MFHRGGPPVTAHSVHALDLGAPRKPQVVRPPQALVLEIEGRWSSAHTREYILGVRAVVICLARTVRRDDAHFGTLHASSITSASGTTRARRRS